MRESVLLFAEMMEQKLRQNDGIKGDWSRTDVHMHELWAGISDEAHEARDALTAYQESPNSDTAAAFVFELADMANYCMMAADYVLGRGKNRGRKLVASRDSTEGENVR